MPQAALVIVPAICMGIFCAGCVKHVQLSIVGRPSTQQDSQNRVEGSAAPQPTITVFEVEPSVIEAGQEALIHWKTSNSTTVEMSQGIGRVNVEGTQKVRPTRTTEYVLLARADQGTTSANVVVRVVASLQRPNGRDAADISSSRAPELRDIYFSSNGADLTDTVRGALQTYAEDVKRILQSTANSEISVEGHCDNHGSTEYSLAIGALRAATVVGYLSALGVPTNRLNSVSFGSEQPSCSETTEDCRTRNNRVHFIVTTTTSELALPLRQ